MSAQPMWISSVTLAAPDPGELADFYQLMLGWTISAIEDDWAQLRAPAGQHGLTTINIEYERYFVRPTGAIPASFQPQAGVRVMLDPAGHPFCLFEA